MSFAFRYVECSIPEGLTIRDWKLARTHNLPTLDSPPGVTQPVAARTDDHQDVQPATPGWVPNFDTGAAGATSSFGTARSTHDRRIRPAFGWGRRVVDVLCSPTVDGRRRRAEDPSFINGSWRAR